MFLKERLRGDGPVLRGVGAAIPSSVAIQAIAAAGADFVMIDREHGPIGREAMHAMITATAGTGCAALVRVPSVDETEVKVALDAGAEGIVFPLVETADDVERCVAAITYPPEGSRGWGPFVAHARFGVALGEYAEAIGPRLVCAVLVETAQAVANIDAILAVPGLDLAIAAPFDLSSALGVRGRFDAPVFVEAIAAIERAAAGAGVPLCGVALDPEGSAELEARGYRALLNGFDVLMLAERTAALRAW